MKSLKGIFFALISSGTFGLIPLFSIPLIQEGMGEGSILFYRFLISTIVMGGICLLRKDSLKISKRDVFPLFGLSLLYAATALFLIYSYAYVPSGIATTIHFLYPILVGVLMAFLFKENRSAILFIAAILSLVGVVFLCWTGSDNIRPIGIGIALLTVFTYAVYIIGINKLKVGQTLSAEVLTFYILLFGAFNFFIYALVTTGIEPIPSYGAFGRLVSLALFATVISDLTLVLAIKYVGSTVTSILGSMEPLVAMAVGVFYFSEHFDGYSLLGVALIILSVILVVSNASKKQCIDPNV